MSRPSPVGRLVRGASFALLFAAAVLAGQPRVVEGQISPADTAAVLLEAAREFERDGLWDVAEAIYVHITERYAGTPAAAAARSRLSAPESDRPARASRVELQVFGTTYGLFLGVAVPAAFGANDPEAYGAGLLIGGPLGLFGSRALLRANPVTEGQARAISWGGVWGGWQGFGWTQILDLGVEEICSDFGCYSNEDNEEELFASMIIGSLAGITGGALLARNPIRSGVSSGAQGGSIWASIYGAMIAALGDPDGDEVLASALIGGNVGLVAGAALASKFDVSRARVRMINLGALVGGVGGLGIDLLVQPDDDETAILIPLIASMAGMGIAIGSTRSSPPDLGGDVPDFGTALLDYRDGRLSMGAPLPMPTMIPLEAPARQTEWKLGLSVEVFRARF